MPAMNKPYRIETDASDYGCGAVLLQPSDNDPTQWNPVAYESKKFSAPERSYPPQERELLGIIHALRTWRCFIDGCAGGYTVYSDHLPLKYFREQDKPTPRLVRWIAELELYAPDIQYKPGKDNNVPDILSRIGSPASLCASHSLEPEYLYSSWIQDGLSRAGEPMDWPMLYINEERVKDQKNRNLLDKHRNDFVVHDRRVYRKVIIDGSGTIKAVPFLPYARRADIVANFHEGFGHANFDTMLKLFIPRFWWPSMRSDLKAWLSMCPSCQVNSRRSQIHKDVMHPLKVPTAFDRWHLDFIGELPTSLQGNRWILVAVDYATNWPIARAVPVASKEAVADFIYDEIVMRFGCPSEILTDHGANFNSGLVNAYLKKVGTHHKLTSAFHPRTNSKVERFNGVFKGMLRKYVNGALHRWDDFINAALWACRIRVHTTTGFSPFYLTYGREPRLPGDVLQPYIDKTTFADPRTVADITSRELAALGQARASAEFKMKAMAEKDKTKWDLHVKQLNIEVGDKVMLTNEGRYGLEPQYKGPYIVVKSFPDYGTYQLQTLAGEPLKSLVHADRLKPAHGITPAEPWYDPTAARRHWRNAMQSAGAASAIPLIPVTKSSSSGDSSTFVLTATNANDPVDPIVQSKSLPVKSSVNVPIDLTIDTSDSPSATVVTPNFGSPLLVPPAVSSSLVHSHADTNKHPSSQIPSDASITTVTSQLPSKPISPSASTPVLNPTHNEPLPSAPTPSVRSRASSIYLSPVASVVSEDIDMPEFILEEQEKIDKTVVAAPPANIPFVSDVSPSTVVQSPGPPSVVVSSPTPSIASKMSLSPSSIHSTCETADHNVRGRTSLCRGANRS
ncbi:hypothetical protein G6F36_012446 [Rhizopus arrhizus]|nr:hypothetical protein G6F36_012446 [Rhizopus arrhizus]